MEVIHSTITINRFSLVQLLSCVQLFTTPWNAAHQASLSITNSNSLLKLMSIELVVPFNHLILCHLLLLLLPSIFPSIRCQSTVVPPYLEFRVVPHNEQGRPIRTHTGRWPECVFRGIRSSCGDFPGGPVIKIPPSNVGDARLDP